MVCPMGLHQCNDLGSRLSLRARNWEPGCYKFGQGVPLRGRQVRITPTRVNDYLGIGELQLVSPWDFGFRFHLDITSGVPEEFVEELREFLRGEWDPSTNVLDHRELGTELAFWNIFQRHSLLPVQKNQKLTHWELKTLKSIHRGERFNVGSVICSRLEEALHLVKPSRLIFPSLITFFCQSAGAPANDDDELVEVGTLMSRWEWNQVDRSRRGQQLDADEEQEEEQPQPEPQRQRRRDEHSGSGQTQSSIHLEEDQMTRILGAIVASELSLHITWMTGLGSNRRESRA